MKIIYILLIGVGLSLNINAQQETKQKEIGICISNLDHFGFTFKSGTNKSLWRFQSLLLSGSNNTIELDTLLTKSKSLGIHIRLGKEHRKNI